MIQLVWRKVGHVLTKLDTLLAYDPAMALPGIHTKAKFMSTQKPIHGYCLSLFRLL